MGYCIIRLSCRITKTKIDIIEQSAHALTLRYISIVLYTPIKDQQYTFLIRSKWNPKSFQLEEILS